MFLISDVFSSWHVNEHLYYAIQAERQTGRFRFSFYSLIKKKGTGYSDELQNPESKLSSHCCGRDDDGYNNSRCFC